ncbi:MAG: 4Fe-4S binding protein [Desulforhopalus sp.]|nr:4Fe-4S binding protein [Desulforhopalus sp.]
MSTPKIVYGRWRLILLTGAFLLILVNPFLNYFYHINFIQGWYQSFGFGSLWFVSPLEGLESLLLTKSVYMPSFIGMAIPVLIALFLGRVFCSWVCPVSFFLELFDKLRKLVTGRKFLKNGLLVAKKILWFVLIAELLLSMILGVPLFVFLSPPGLIGREIMMLVFFQSVALEGVILLLILLLELSTRRFFCRTFCPLGGLLAFLGSKRSLRVHVDQANCTNCGICEKSCPMGLLPSIGEGTSAYCWNCGECVDSCCFDALHFHWQEK